MKNKKQPDLALIDGDILTYRIGFAYKNEPLNLCLWNVNKSIDTIVDRLGCSKYLVYITSDDGSNFRKAVRADYKANRTAPKPLYYTEIRRHLSEHHNAITTFGIEADDGIGIAHSKSDGIDSVICSIDKDFRQIPGWNFHFVRKELDWISRDEAESFFWQQVITGDRVDNVRGVKGYGPKKSAIWLEGCSTAWDYLRAVRRLYLEHFGALEGDLRLVENLNLLRIKRTEEENLITLDDIEASLKRSLPLYSGVSLERGLSMKLEKSPLSNQKRKERT